MSRPFAPFRAAILTAFLIKIAPVLVAAQTAHDPSQFEPEIKAFEAADRTNPPPKNAILFVGSSTIRLWKTLAQDFPDLKVINRGFGGSHLSDSTFFADRIILPYQPKTIVLYAGDNDLAAGKTPEQVFADCQAFIQKIRAKLPETRIVYLSIKPSPSRWHLKDQIQAANRMISGLKDDRLLFIDTYSPMLNPDGQPRAELFQKDNLHMNAEGYKLWTSLIKPYLK
jgi:lysophospholipase L1-like esterase